MKVLFSYVIGQWKGFKEIIAEEKPDVLLMAVDVFPIPPRADVLREIHEIEAGTNLLTQARAIDPRIFEGVFRKDLDIQRQFEFFTKYQEFAYKLSVDRFYSELRDVSQICKVFTVKPRNFIEENYGAKSYSYFINLPGYEPTKIDTINNCKEISGKIVDVAGLRILGLGGLEFGFRRNLRPILKDSAASPPDLVLASPHLHHSERVQRIRWICSLLKPKLFIYGYYCGLKMWLMDDVWIVEAGAFPHDYVTLQMDRDRVDDIAIKRFNPEANKYEEKKFKRAFDPEENQITYR